MFWFINYWANDEDFLSIIDNCWSIPMVDLQRNIIRTQSKFQLWHKHKFRKIDQQISDLKNEIRS